MSQLIIITIHKLQHSICGQKSVWITLCILTVHRFNCFRIFVSIFHPNTAYQDCAVFTNINIMIMIVILLGLLFAPSAGRLFKHDSKLARSLCRGCAPADCCFHAMKPERLLRTCHACFHASAFPPTHEGRMHRSAPGNSLLFCCVASQ